MLPVALVFRCLHFSQGESERETEGERERERQRVGGEAGDSGRDKEGECEAKKSKDSNRVWEDSRFPGLGIASVAHGLLPHPCLLPGPLNPTIVGVQCS